MSTPKISLVAITDHGVYKIVQLAPKLSYANILVADKFRELLANTKNSRHFIMGHFVKKFPDFSRNTLKPFFVPLGTVVPLCTGQVQPDIFFREFS